jgi:hypothetical protein
MTSLDYFRQLTLLKKLFWVYFFLLIFEGALRKWVVPQFSAPLLVVRDPICIMIIWEAYRTRKWPSPWSVVISLLTVLLVGLFLLQSVLGDNPWYLELYGLTSYLLPFPVAFIMGENLDEDDLRKFGTCTIWLLLPLTALEAAQYLAPAGSVLNKGAYEGGEQLSYADSHVRASATFSFVTGPTNYVPLTAAFVLYGIVTNKLAKSWLLWAGASAVVLAVPLTGSRTQGYLLLAMLACVVAAAALGLSQFARAFKAIVIVSAVFGLVSFLPIFDKSMGTLTTRFASSTETEGGAQHSLFSRLIEPMLQVGDDTLDTRDWLGVGMGRAANLASTLLAGTDTSAASVELEFPRIITEFGPFFGGAFLLFRLSLAVLIVGRSLARVRDGESLAWLLVPLTLSNLVWGKLDQPTEQGFMVISIAFSLGALRGVDIPTATAPPLVRVAGRYATSIGAQKLMQRAQLKATDITGGKK